MELSERIRRAREGSGVGREQLCEALCISRANLDAWETGTQEPTLTQITKMCELLQVSPDYLLSGKDPDGIYADVLCPACGAELSPGIKFCPQCGRQVQPEDSAPAAGSASSPQERTFSLMRKYTLVVSTDTNTGIRPSVATGIRIFLQNDNYACPSRMSADGRLLMGLSTEETEEYKEALIRQAESGKAVVLCRGLPYGKAVKTLDMFFERANVFVYCDDDGSTLEELSQATPVAKYELGDAKYSDGQALPSSPSGQSSAQPPAQTGSQSDGKMNTLMGLAIAALILLIVVLALSLL